MLCYTTLHFTTDDYGNPRPCRPRRPPSPHMNESNHICMSLHQKGLGLRGSTTISITLLHFNPPATLLQDYYTLVIQQCNYTNTFRLLHTPEP